jgi:hypothetical protein
MDHEILFSKISFDPGFFLQKKYLSYNKPFLW